MTQEFCGFLLLMIGGGGSECGASCMAGAGPGFRFFFFCLHITMKIKILNSIKTKEVERLFNV